MKTRTASGFMDSYNKTSDDIERRKLVAGIIIVAKLIVAPLIFQYTLWSLFMQDVPWYIDILAGIYFYKYVVPVGMVCLVVRHCGNDVPLIESLKGMLVEWKNLFFSPK